MGFELPRLRVKIAQIVHNYSEFIINPAPFLKELYEELSKTDNSLAEECLDLMGELSKDKGVAKAEILDSFISKVKQFVSKNSSIINPNDEIRLQQPISTLAGLGAKLSEALNKFGTFTVKDVIYNLPFRYEELAENAYGGKGVLIGTYEKSSAIRTRYGKQIFQAVFRGKMGFFYGMWLHFNRQFPSSVLKEGATYYLYGAITNYSGAPSIFHPELLESQEVGSVRQVYSLPAKVSQKVYQKAVNDALKEYLPYVNETLPENLRTAYNYPDVQDALNILHRPATSANAKLISERKHKAVQRMVYEELFYLQLRIFLKKYSYAQSAGVKYDIPKEMLNEIAEIMPFRLTNAQRESLREIFTDMKSEGQMNRLLQGDVGSGKTIVAFVAALVAVKNGYQSVILAPTEVLAEQHYTNLEKFLRGTGFHVCLLTGSVKAKEKKEIKNAVANGDVQFVVGTHALIQEDVEFKNLGFAVIDEQHRFGVRQRKALMDKGFTPDILLMTATPIPRTLALTYHGDLDLSEIGEMPPGRIPPVTKAFKETMLKDAFAFVAEHLKDGERAYFVYPAIEESDKTTLKSVTKNYETIKKYFKNKKVGLLHGKMKAEEKRQMLQAFQSGTVDILVSTTVVEVGVDVKDATIILIENADRFGLAQLHQLRGRVGRNDKQSYCVLVGSENISEVGFKRLRAMEQFTSGFKLAELDLELRGQGDFFGVKQSGIPEFQFADIIKDSDILRAARTDAEKIIKDDPHLSNANNSLIKSVLMQRWKEEYELFLVG